MMVNAVKYFFLFLFATILLVGAWIYLNEDVELTFGEERCSDIETYEEFGEDAADYQGDYTKTYADRIRDILHGCF